MTEVSNNSPPTTPVVVVYQDGEESLLPLFEVVPLLTQNPGEVFSMMFKRMTDKEIESWGFKR